MRVGIALQLKHEIAQMVVLIDAALANHRVLLDLLELVAYFLALQVRAATLAATHRQLVARNPSLAIEAAPERNLPLHASKLLAPVVLHHGEEFRWFESAGHLFFLLRFQRITEARIISNNSLSLSPRHCGNSLSTKIMVASSLLLAGDLAERSRTLRPILHPGSRFGFGRFCHGQRSRFQRNQTCFNGGNACLSDRIARSASFLHLHS